MISEIVSDTEINEQFIGKKFGVIDNRKFLETSVLKVLVGFHCGNSITNIMINLKLITKKGIVTKRGKQFTFELSSRIIANEKNS
jgi:ribosomal protein S19